LSLFFFWVFLISIINYLSPRREKITMNALSPLSPAKNKKQVCLYLDQDLVAAIKLRVDNLSELVNQLLRDWLATDTIDDAELARARQELEQAQQHYLQLLERKRKYLADAILRKKLQPWIECWQKMKKNPQFFPPEECERWLEESARKLQMSKEELLRYLG
jgi:hypothetical protein